MVEVVLFGMLFEVWKICMGCKCDESMFCVFVNIYCEGGFSVFWCGM